MSQRPSLRPSVSRSLQLLLLPLLLAGCASRRVQAPVSAVQVAPLLQQPLTGDIAPVRDPSIFLQAGVYYVFSTDAGRPIEGHHLPIRCSSDKTTWRLCGQVFTSIPEWIKTAVPGIRGLWAPDISFFNGLYHVYYSGSTLGSQNSVIGLATNTTLDPSAPGYQWVDRGQVLASSKAEDFNAIDPTIIVDTNQKVWLSYGSYWSGIKQREIDPATGMLLASNPTRYDLASRPNTPDHAIEGASLVHHGRFYYLFLSIDHCCARTIAQDDYKQAVGRSTTPHGPFVDAQGRPLKTGGATILLEGNPDWIAPGGGTAYVDAATGESLLVFHVLDVAHAARPSLWLKKITWTNDWPALSD